MAEEDDSQKTEDPTEKKLSKAREKGQVAQSQEIKSWALLLAGTTAIFWLSPWVMSGVNRVATPFLVEPHTIPTDMKSLQFMVWRVGGELMLYVGPVSDC